MGSLIPVLAASLIANSGIEPTPADIAWIARGEFCEPETVLPLPDETLLVSNVCGFRTPGTGFLTLLNAQGDVVDWRIVDGLDAPLGMAFGHDRLYVIDTNRIRVFTWPAYETVDMIDLDTTVANDIAVAPDGTLYVTDTAQHAVVRVSTDGRRTTIGGNEKFTGANGIALAGDNLYVGGERLWRVELQSGHVETVGPDWLVDIDGIEFEDDGTLQVTPVGGPLVRLSADNSVEILSGDGISSANHGYSAVLGLALIPTGFDNAVIAIHIPGAEND